MSSSESFLSGRLGSLETSPPGARGLEHMARNRQCLRLTALTLAGVSPAEASGKVYGRAVQEGLSPFAIRRGERFEAALFENQGERLFNLYTENGRLSEEERRLEDLSRSYPDDLRLRLEASERLVGDRALGEPGLPNILIKPRLSVVIAGQQFFCEPDALMARDQDKHWRVVEIKSYADRWGRTSLTKTGSACRQAAVGLLALEQCSASSSTEVDLVFARPGSNWPTLHSMDVSGELQSLRRTLGGSEEAAERIMQLIGDLDLEQGIQKIPNNPCSDCADHCALWHECRSQMVNVSSPRLLGDGAADLMVGLDSLDEALELRQRGSSPDPDLDRLARLLQAAQAAYDQEQR